jgi:hypothetical protein
MVFKPAAECKNDISSFSVSFSDDVKSGDAVL